MLLAGSLSAADAPVVIQLRVLDGEGAMYAIGSRATRGLTVQVADENGKPVENASVSFQLPSDGPSGSFPDSGKSAIVTTGADGRATIWGMQWNKVPGEFEIRVTASKGQARAGIAVRQYLAENIKQAGGEGTFTVSHRGRNKWLLLSVVAAGAVAGLAVARSSSKTATPAPTAAPVQIGNPGLIVGPPK